MLLRRLLSPLVPPGQIALGGAGALTSRVRVYSMDEAQDMLVGLVQVNVRQLREGQKPILEALRNGTIRYQSNDPHEEWRTIRDVWANAGGDCEDLAAAYAAERTVNGHPSRVAIIRLGPGSLHAITEDIATGERWDPSLTGGMMVP